MIQPSRCLLPCLVGLFVALVCTGCAAPEPVRIRVLSYNIHHGEGLDGQIDLERIARVIRESGADLAALQEVDRGTQRTGRVDQPVRLAELTGMIVVFAKNIDHEGGEYGNAILSRLPVEGHRNHPLPLLLKPGEQRGLLEARVRVGGQRLLLCATHFDHRPGDADRLASAEWVGRFTRERAELPIVLAGDLNARPDSPVLQELCSLLMDTCPPGLPDALTAPAGRPRHRIDYILFNRHPGLRAIDYAVIPETVASDHRPVVATFEMVN